MAEPTSGGTKCWFNKFLEHVEHYAPGLMITSAFMPMFMAGVTLLVSIVWSADHKAVWIGIAAGLILWCFTAWVAERFATIQYANPDVYYQLRCRFDILQTQMKTLLNASHNYAQPPCKDLHSSRRREIAVAEIQTYLYEVGNELHPKSATIPNKVGEVRGELAPESVTIRNMDSRQDWVLGYGYIILQKQIHRMEENFLLIAPCPTVLAEARYDSLRLQESTIPNQDALLRFLKSAVTVLNAWPNLPAPVNPPPGEWTPKDKPEAREVLRQVRRTINEFRDERRTGIVRARNRLFRTLTLTGLMTFFLVALAALTPATVNQLMAGATFFLIGSIVGVFNQLYLDAGTEVATEDYGLAVVRLLHTPMISGLAALISVAIIPVLSTVVNSSMVSSSTPTGLGPDAIFKSLTSFTPTMPSLDTIFKLPPSLFSLVLAAIFGISPVILIGRLQQEANRYKADLKSSEPSFSRSGVTPPL